MQTNREPTKILFNEFSAPERQQIARALAIAALIPEDAHYHRPQSVDVAAILMDFNIDVTTILAAILSDPRLETLTTLAESKKQFGDTVAALVKDVNWLNKLTVYSPEMTDKPHQAETLRRMLLSMTQDVRAVLIKLAYRIQLLRQLPQVSYEERRFISQETLDIYAPIANRLGIHQFKWELEDMAFRYLEPATYRQIAKSLATNRIQRENCVTRFINLLQSTLAEEGISCQCYGRPKHIYSIWKKMQRKQLLIDELYDLLAVRVIVDNLSHCYTALGIVHNLWQTIPKEFDDYIANPKENGYQSLHTVILDAENNRIEVQIRTQDMHDYAELGVAAHWSYKEGGKQTAAMEQSVATLRKLLEEQHSAEDLGDNFRSELFSDRIYVLTPTGKLIDLVKGVTPLDFAYAIHTEVGHRCRGAKVNGRIVPLTYALKSGEQIEILTAKEGAPNHNWIDPNLGYLKSSRAISRVKRWFGHQQQAAKIALGKAILDKECHRLGIKPTVDTDALKHFKQPDMDTLLEAIGKGLINSRQLAAFLKVPEFENTLTHTKPKKSAAKSVISVAGIDNVQTSLAHCCSPVLSDDIIGYISHHHGITVHRNDCKNITHLSAEKQAQLVVVTWSAEKTTQSDVATLNRTLFYKITEKT
ncbi:MAG: bifunctional (p)ppGpp synthetase/guanosine-3',5'-bis(diphosphate) 3'-pyrophosphohydrolase [Methylococcales bacterium]|nr:bifunctional (p)ppGpp synthetase/guanosine-3',5'-bis(diphosphate) 3'-pyrophosphohydrolase [Methylococcales bacterium]